MNDVEQRKAAKEFAARWENRGDEKKDTQTFWSELLTEVLGVEHISEVIEFEKPVQLTHRSFIDAYIEKTHVLIEQKSLGKKMNQALKQSDGEILTPFQQAKRYANELPYSLRPRWIVTCNFSSFYIYDMDQTFGEPKIIQLAELPTDYYRLKFLIDTGNKNIEKEMQVSMEAGELVGKLYNAFLKEYKDNSNEESLRSLNKLCVRLVFCLYAEDAGIFGEHNMFHDYLKRFEVRDLRRALIDLFQILDQKQEERDTYLDPSLKAFPYVNGGLFADEHIEIPNFTEEIRNLLLQKASAEFDWSNISPTIFGAVFESTLNPETRRSGGMHYTSIENIHKVIDPLFLDDLKNEFTALQNITKPKIRKQKLLEFQKKLAGLKFLDPACGSGNFLTETYISLRRLENEALTIISNGEMVLGEIYDPIQVKISQFYGIEINDFAVSVAKTALWIAESQMMKETEDIVHKPLDFLPLKTYTNIHEGNALRMDWENVVPKHELNYIMGNPPFVGASMMNKQQKAEAIAIFGKIKLSNSIDYVGAWYYKASEMLTRTHIKAALVSTNSITQGEQVAALWKPLFEKYNIHIDFAYKTFRWDSEASLKAHVHCVIIGFSNSASISEKILFSNGMMQKVTNINAYLLDAPNVFVTSRSKPLCNVPKLTKGNQPTDNGNFILNEKERKELLAKDKSLEKCIRRYVGAKDFLNNNEIRYCLWLKNIPPNIYYKNKEILRRLEAIKIFRENSSAAPTRKFAEKPYLFFSSPQTEEPYLIVPRHSSEKRKYIPIGFMSPEIIASDACSIICGATLYHFGVLTSNVHMAWMRAIAGRLEMRYRYSGSVVYNTFPWPTPSKEQKTKIENTAQNILNLREKYSDCSLAILYNVLTMPNELLEAHRANDRAVMEAYCFDVKTMTESTCVAELMKLYQKLVEK